MNKLRPWLLLILVFAAGVVAGIAGTRLMIHRAAANPIFLRERMERELVVQLKLSPEQRVKVHEALVESQKQIMELRRDFQPRIAEILDNTRRNIAATLTPEQREKLQKLIKERKDRWKLPNPERPFAPRQGR